MSYTEVNMVFGNFFITLQKKNMKIQLTQEEVIFLKKLHKSQKEKVKADRIKIILLLNQGFTNEQVAEILLLDFDTVTKWKHRFLERTDINDLTLWIEDNYVSNFGKLSCTQISWLRNYINTFKVADKKELIEVLQNSFNVVYEKSGLQKLLHRIGFSNKKIHKLPGGVDLEKQAEFINFFFELMGKLTDKETFVFIDSVHPQHNSNNSKMWIETGKDRWIQSNTGRQHVNINGAYNPITQDVITVQAPTINHETTIELLKLVSEKTTDKELIYVFCDNASYNKSKEVKAFLATQTKIKMVYLPPYSPNLNLIERLWKFMRKNVINLKYYATFQLFKDAITKFFNNIQKYKNELSKFITINFQTFENAKL